MDATTRKSIEFFADNAGYATPPGRMVCARNLARAEEYASEQGWIVTWEPDDNEPLDAHEEWCPVAAKGKGASCEHEIFVAVLAISGFEQYALGGIIDPTPAYQRVINAELYSEALAMRQRDPQEPVQS